MRGLKGNNVIITGGASGIGQAISLRLGEEGCNVGIFDMNEDGANGVAEKIRAAGGTAKVYECDISDYGVVEASVAAFETDCGPADGLINNAGWDKSMPFLDTDLELWHKVIAINLYGPLNLCHVVLAGMSERGSGRVVNISSDAGRVGSSGEAVYAACKGGLIAFSKTMSRELARKGITLNTICPGPTNTPLLAEQGPKLVAALERAVPMKRVAEPEDYPGLACFFLSDDASYITGQTISVSGGLTMHG
ncbi:MAG: SDR family oxidoreductase [Rhodospirillaceae bacterium]|nr:SDR family oxidoreductase [Rhodospirillaceae bacterium]MBT5895508.1 SDR family oxidoreductase [Rhodospirillaceae bacterium]MBT6427117.1 SDR family oxidoreductase [Rhodospirillaceae bacterium]MBT7664602.1 SDR family oxidoreductase [Rhodospirillaceae bacterium]